MQSRSLVSSVNSSNNPCIIIMWTIIFYVFITFAAIEIHFLYHLLSTFYNFFSSQIFIIIYPIIFFYITSWTSIILIISFNSRKFFPFIIILISSWLISLSFSVLDVMFYMLFNLLLTTENHCCVLFHFLFDFSLISWQYRC